MVVELISPGDLRRAKTLIESCGLRFETNFDNLVGIFEEGQLAAVGARHRNILKMLAIAPAFQGGQMLGELVTELVRLGLQAEIQSFFVFTPPRNLAPFQALNFTPLVTHHKVALLEYGNGLKRYLGRHASLVRPGRNGAVVMNCNPFTLGHRYLVEEAAARVDTLYLFVVREDRSLFPFDVRMRLVTEGVKDLGNVVVLDSSDYAVSEVTFPSYFLKSDEGVEQLQMELDLVLFGKHLAPFFHIERRFIGTEPYCRTTRTYSETMKRVLLPFGIETVQIERREVSGRVVSAYRVREALRQEAYETVRRLVPPSTLNYLLSDEAEPLRRQMTHYNRRH